MGRLAAVTYYLLVVPAAAVARLVRDPLGTRPAESRWTELDAPPPSLARARRMR